MSIKHFILRLSWSLLLTATVLVAFTGYGGSH